MRNLSPAELQQMLRQAPPVLVDVREAGELALAALPEVRHIPLAELSTRHAELDPAVPVVLICHHGVRSEMAGRFLERNGFGQVMHLSGGIDAWSQQIDPSVPRY